MTEGIQSVLPNMRQHDDIDNISGICRGRYPVIKGGNHG